MENSIGTAAIKIACIQTIPGKEFEVKSRLEAACQTPEITNYQFFKGLGTFDIILLYSTKDFGSYLRKTGVIPFILKSNILLCYPYLNKDSETIFSSIRDTSFTGFSLLKISPGMKRYIPNVERLLRNYVAHNDNWSYLGTLGWNEAIVLINNNDIGSLIYDLYFMGSLYLPDENFSVLTKTLSFIGINYKIIPPLSEIEKGSKEIKAYLRKNWPIEIPVKKSHDVPHNISIDITVNPTYTHEIISYFKRKKYDVSLVIGKTDIVAKPKGKMAIYNILGDVLYLRFHYQDKLFSTSSCINFNARSYKNNKEIGLNYLPFKFSYPGLEETFGPDMASALANHFYTFNTLIQNPLFGSVYADMVAYFDYIVKTGAYLKAIKQEVNYFAQLAREVIKQGAELRSYGTYETIEEVTGRFSEFKGGCQLAILGVEYLPNYLMEKIKKSGWKGFVITGDPTFYRVGEVINVPPEALWNPETWWAMYHEIGHIVLDYLNMISFDQSVIKQFLYDKINPKEYLELISEIAAEIIGYQLGFFGDYDLFLKKLWKLLTLTSPYQVKKVSYDAYAVRSFFVELYEGHFKKSTMIKPVSKNEFNNLDYLYNRFLNHLNRIERELNASIFDDIEFLASSGAKLFKELYPIAHHISKGIADYPLIADKKYLNYKNTTDVLESLMNGKIWWKPIISPEAVLYYLFKGPENNFNARIATVISFWNQQIRKGKF